MGKVMAKKRPMEEMHFTGAKTGCSSESSCGDRSQAKRGSILADNRNIAPWNNNGAKPESEGNRDSEGGDESHSDNDTKNTKRKR